MQQRHRIGRFAIVFCALSLSAPVLSASEPASSVKQAPLKRLAFDGGNLQGGNLLLAGGRYKSHRGYRGHGFKRHGYGHGFRGHGFKRGYKGYGFKRGFNRHGFEHGFRGRGFKHYGRGYYPYYRSYGGYGFGRYGY